MATVVYSTFRPLPGSNRKVTATSTSQYITVSPATSAVRICNTGNHLAYIRLGQGLQTATANDMPILQNESVVAHKEYGENTIAYVSESTASTTLHIQVGDGE